MLADDLFLSYCLFISCLCHTLGRAVSPDEPRFLHQPVNVLLRVTPVMTADFSAPFSYNGSQKIAGGLQWVSPTPLSKDYQPLSDISYFSASFI